MDAYQQQYYRAENLQSVHDNEMFLSIFMIKY